MRPAAVAAVALLAMQVPAAEPQSHAHQAPAGNQAGGDARQFVSFPEPMRLHTITSMRDHLLALQQIGTQMHRAASRFAVEAENASVSNDVRPALAALGAVMSQCVACHASYRLH